MLLLAGEGVLSVATRTECSLASGAGLISKPHSPPPDPMCAVGSSVMMVQSS